MVDNRRSDDSRLDEILRKLERQDELLDLKLAPFSEMLKVHNRTIFGDGTDGYPGLYKDVDRIKQSSKIWRVIGVAVGFPILADVAIKIWGGIQSLMKGGG